MELCPYLYLLSRRGLSLRGGGEALRSESESDTGRRGRDAEEVGREVDQLWATGEDRGLGRVDTPDRDLEKAKTVSPQTRRGMKGDAKKHKTSCFLTVKTCEYIKVCAEK